MRLAQICKYLLVNYKKTFKIEFSLDQAIILHNPIDCVISREYRDKVYIKDITPTLSQRSNLNTNPTFNQQCVSLSIFKDFFEAKIWFLFS